MARDADSAVDQSAFGSGSKSMRNLNTIKEIEMHKGLLSLGVLVAIPLAIVTATPPASAHYEAAVPQKVLTPANDKEAHVPIWFTLQISGAESAAFVN